MPSEIKFPQFAGRTWLACGLAFVAANLHGQDSGGPLAAGEWPRVAGSLTCSSTECHGGASVTTRQFVIWSQRDVHSRAYATLTTARAARMAEALRIPDPTASPRCTACHAPLQTVDPPRLLPDARVSEGVSCASCHGPSESWLRSHPRQDYSHADRVAAGMRDLRDLTVRANTCVACHQNIPPDLVNVGRHPALLFELDGQTQAAPRHWREPDGRSGAQAWIVGQAVAWRETSWALLNGAADAVRELPRWAALGWLLQRTGLGGDLVAAPAASLAVDTAPLAAAMAGADRLARAAAQAWSPESAWLVLGRLAGTAEDFRGAGETTLALACRAERLVLALDRLLAALPPERRPVAAAAQLDRLFALAQSQPDFAPRDFARELAVLADGLRAAAP